MWITILELIVIVAMCLVVGALRLKSMLIISIEELIAQAENKALTGTQKMQWVVSQIYCELKPIAKVYFTTERIQSIAQAVFDRVRRYANKYIENVNNN